MSKAILFSLNYRTLVVATLCFIAMTASHGTTEAAPAQVVYQHNIGNVGKIVFYSSGHYRIFNYTTTDLYFRFRIVPKSNPAFKRQSIVFCYASSRTRPIDCIWARGGRIQKVIINSVSRYR